MDKWMAIVLAMFITGMFAPVVVSEHNKSQCKIEAIKAQMPAADIKELCK